MAIDDTIKTKPVNPSWKDSGFDQTLQRNNQQPVSQGQYIPGATFNTLLGEMLFNRMIKLKNVASAQFPQKTDPGKIFWDQDNKKFKLYVDGNSQYVDLLWTSTSTTSSSSSSSSSSTSSTSSSSSSTSSTSSSTSSTSSSTSTTHT